MNVRKDIIKIIVFGVGKFYQNRRETLKQYQTVDIVAFSDNNRTLWGKTLEDVRIIPPDTINEIACDGILIMSTYAREISEQLITAGIDRTRIFYWEPFYAKMMQGERKIYSGINKNEIGRKVLIISTELDYNGGSLAAVYAAAAVQNRGNCAVLAVPSGNKKIVEEIVGMGITVEVCPSLPYVYEKDKEWIRQFEMVIVNVYQMMHSAYACSLLCPTLWWIHEPIEIYKSITSKPWNNIEEKQLEKISIYAVSGLAKGNFNTFFPGHIKESLHYGIPDMALGKRIVKEKQSTMVFAIIGTVCERKAQDVFVDAIQQLNCDEKVEFWIIGQLNYDMFCEKITGICNKIPAIKLKGLLTREEIYDIFSQIDVVVCTSREDPLPIVMTEGMMFGKTCITTDHTGTSAYISDGENGFVVPAGDSKALKEKMEWAIHNRDKLESIGKKARETYEKYFTMDVFGKNLEKAIEETIERWEGI